MRTLALLTLILLAAACRPETPEAQDVLAQYDAYGATLTPEGALPAAAVAADVESYLDAPVKIEAPARSVCQKAGCWVSLSAGEGETIRVHVPRDSSGTYRFTLPDSVRGQTVIAHGTLQQKPLSDEALAHMRADAGDSTYTPTDLHLLADAVLVHRL